MKLFEKAKQQDWYQNPQMLGHRWAIDSILIAEEALAKYYADYANIVDYLLYTHSTDWRDYHYSKKYIKRCEKFIKNKVARGRYTYLLPGANVFKDRLDYTNDVYNACCNTEKFRNELIIVRSNSYHGYSQEDVIKSVDEKIKELQSIGEALKL